MIASHTIVYLYRILVIVTIGAVVGAMVWHYVEQQTSEVRSELEAAFATVEDEARAVVASNALAATRPAYAPLLDTCSRNTQNQFDDRLNQLGTGLSQNDLAYLATQFDRCAGQFAREQVIRGAILHQSVSHMEILHDLMQTIAPVEESDPVLVAWQEVAEAETALGTLQTELVEAQRALVEARREGQSVNSADIQATLADVESIRASTTAARDERKQWYDELGL